MIFQEPMTSLNPVLTIGRQLTEAIRAHRRSAAARRASAALEALKAVRISEPERRLRQYPHELSGGMRQRVMIAMALAGEPKVLIADEPTTALDVTVQAQILDLMRNLQRDFGMALILITHDMGVVAEMADRVVVMHDGRMVEAGPVGEIFARPRSRLHAAAARRGAAASAPMRGDERAPLPRHAAVASRARIAPAATGRHVSDLTVGFDIMRRLLRRPVAARACGRRHLASTSAPARRWRSSANRAAASRRPAGRSSTSSPGRATSASTDADRAASAAAR